MAFVQRQKGPCGHWFIRKGGHWLTSKGTNWLCTITKHHCKKQILVKVYKKSKLIVHHFKQLKIKWSLISSQQCRLLYKKMQNLGHPKMFYFLSKMGAITTFPLTPKGPLPLTRHVWGCKGTLCLPTKQKQSPNVLVLQSIINWPTELIPWIYHQVLL